MTIEFKLPELGENIEAGDVVNILVAVGDAISIDDPILELETDKATIEIPSSVSGIIKSLHVSVNDTILVGQTILTTEADGTKGAEPLSAQGEDQPPATQIQPQVQTAGTASPEGPQPETITSTSSSTVEFKLPNLGENIEAGTVVGILVSVGDNITVDQGVLEIETDKATAEVPSPLAGTVKVIHVAENDEVVTDQLILTIETAISQTPNDPSSTVAPEATSPAQPDPIPVEVDIAAPASVPAPATGSPKIFLAPKLIKPRPRLGHSAIPAAPNIRRLAREIGVEITHVTGSGPRGRITLDDVKRHAREMPRGGVASPEPARRVASVSLPDFSKWGDTNRQAMSNIRRATAEHMDRAWSTIPHVTQFDKADITDLEQLRKRFGKKVEQAGGKLTITAILLKVVTAALKEFPQFNASIDMARHEIIYKAYYHIGIAVDTERGLLVPVIRNVDQKNILELAVELGQIAEKARDRKLSLDDMQGGTFTITNLGGIGGTNFTPIINAPEVAILGVSRGGKAPIFNSEGQLEPRLMIPLSVSYDHRLIDGADGARFLRYIVEHLEQPFLTALQGW